jgi:hypothetical protein
MRRGDGIRGISTIPVPILSGIFGLFMNCRGERILPREIPMTLFLILAVYGGIMIKYVDLVTTYSEEILTKTVVDSVLAQLELRLNYVACPNQHESPQILLVGPVTDLKIEVRTAARLLWIRYG